MLNIREKMTETTWAKVKKRADAGKIESGERFTFNLKTGEEVTVKAARDTKTGKLFFVLEDCLEEEQPMNKKGINEGGWAASDMRKYLNKTILMFLPDDLREIIVPTKIVQIVDGVRVECQDRLFLLSETQVFGMSEESEFEPEDTQLDIFQREKDRIKECGENGTQWWLRSPSTWSSYEFCYASPTGIRGRGNAADSCSVVFGFSLCGDAEGRL